MTSPPHPPNSSDPSSHGSQASEASLSAGGRDTFGAQQSLDASATEPTATQVQHNPPSVLTGSMGRRRSREKEIPEIPGYTIEDELGRGAMGVVYRAKNTNLNRPVAIKMILGDANERSNIRFLAEAESVAAIDHPNVVRVYQYGEVDGQPFMVLEYLSGGTLKDVLTQHSHLPVAGALRVMEQICRGVNAAHQLGIVHRDLKPANILLQARQKPDASADDSTVDFREGLFAKVSDFGLAKRSTGIELTMTNDLVGTPAYMSPEQAGGMTKFVGPTSDVWALGIMLYEALTGRRPFQGETIQAVLTQILAHEAATLAPLGMSLPRELETICQKCLAKKPTDRYQTAGEVAEELRRYQAGEPILARSPTLWSSVRAWTGQNFGSAGWAVLGGVGFGVLLGAYSNVGMLGIKLPDQASVYDQLPSIRKPWVAFSRISDGINGMIEVALVPVIATIIFFSALFARARNRSADLAGGLLIGLFAAIVFYAVGFGWWTVYSQAMLPAKAEMEWLSQTDAELIARYPDTAEMSHHERIKTLLRKIHYDTVTRIPIGLITGMLFSMGFTFPTSFVLVPVAGGIIRRTTHRVHRLLLFFERALPWLVFVGYVMLIGQRAVIYHVSPQYPGVYGMILIYCLVVFMMPTWSNRVWWRVAVWGSWFVTYAITNGMGLYEF